MGFFLENCKKIFEEIIDIIYNMLYNKKVNKILRKGGLKMKILLVNYMSFTNFYNKLNNPTLDFCKL